MNFQDLHESVRVELERRVQAGLITATSLAHQSGFRQAHISNFLNRRRSLSLDGLDRVLAAQNLSVDELLLRSSLHGGLPVEISAAAGAADGYSAGTREASQAVPVVAHSTAMEEAVVRPGSVIEVVYIPTSRLGVGRARPSTRTLHWQRFVAVRVDAQQAAAMDPMLAADSIAVLDRHYNSLAPHRAHQRTLYAVRSGSGLMLRYLEFDDARLILRPMSLAFPVQLIALGEDESPGDYIVGRVALVLSEV
jgi:hypothetical protein